MTSWDEPSTPFIVRMGRHNDHHLQVYRPMQCLRKFAYGPSWPDPVTLVDSLTVACAPLVWFYIMDPRIKSLNDFRKGIPNKDQWNMSQPKSEDDKRRNFYVYVYLYINVIFISYLYFNTYSETTPFKEIKESVFGMK